MAASPAKAWRGYEPCQRMDVLGPCDTANGDAGCCSLVLPLMGLVSEDLSIAW